MAFIFFIFFIAAAISSVAAYFSLAGMGALFAATFWGVVVMTGTLEVGKIVATKWVHANWRNPRAPWYFRGLFCVFIAALMTITSLGIYGYLSKGHLEQSAPVAGLSIQVAQLETQLRQKQTENDQLQKRLDQISRITDKSLETSGRAGLRAAGQQRKESGTIQGRIDANNTAINDLNTKLIPLKTQGAEVEAKLGPVKYVAELFGWDPESAVRIIIVIIMIAFDPLALSLFIAGSISLKDYQDARLKRDDPKEELGRDPAPEPVADLDPHLVDTAQQQERPVLTNEVADHFKDELEDIMERDQRAAVLDEAKEAIAREREEFETAMADVTRAITLETSDLEAAKAQIVEDQAALQDAHQQLLDMEARINDERELLGQWEESLTQQQQAINAWKPNDVVTEDGKNPKELIIEVLEMNPDIVNDIVQVAIAMQNARPGL
jgi:hypothetical protein